MGSIAAIGTDISDPTLYDLIINTGKIQQAAAVDLIVKALESI